MEFKGSYSRQFSNAFDVYLDIRVEVNRRVQAILGRDSPDWRLRHACPACTYKLKGEERLIFEMLDTMDGNDSQKRVMKRSKTEVEEDDGKLGPSSEVDSSRTVHGDRYLTREYVDQYAKGAIQEMMSDIDPVSFVLLHNFTYR